MDYEEKLRLAKEALESGSYDKETIEYIFPELRESEDEKIRKNIIELVKQAEQHIHGDGVYSKEISWLEKQGEDKEINNFNVLPGLYKCVHRMFDGTPDGKLLFEVGNIYKCLSKHDRAEFEVSYGHSVYLEDPVVCKHFIPFEKQGEQKSQRIISAEAKEAMYDNPAWGEYDEEFLRRAIKATTDVYPVTADWLKSLKERLKGE